MSPIHIVFIEDSDKTAGSQQKLNKKLSNNTRLSCNIRQDIQNLYTILMRLLLPVKLHILVLT